MSDTATTLASCLAVYIPKWVIPIIPSPMTPTVIKKCSSHTINKISYTTNMSEKPNATCASRISTMKAATLTAPATKAVMGVGAPS